MNKLPCYIVRDMLPQYAEDLLGEESKRDIEQHLEECQDCKELYHQMTSPEPEIKVDTAEVDYLKKVKKNRSRIITAAIVIVALVAVGAFVNSRIQAAKATFNFDEASKTLVIYGRMTRISRYRRPSMKLQNWMPSLTPSTLRCTCLS